MPDRSTLRVLVTRAAHQGSDLADRLRSLGLTPVLIPAIELTDPSSFAPLDTALAELGRFDWLLFTSANAVEAFARRFGQGSGSPGTPFAPRPVPPAIKIAAIGPATARALEKLGLTPHLVPPAAVAESLTESLLPHARQPDGSPTRFILIRAEDAREHLPETLRAAGAEVVIVPAYRTVIPAGSAEALRTLFAAGQGSGPGAIAAITFTSSSTARNLLALCDSARVTLPDNAHRISIGPITTQTLRELGFPPHAESPEATVPALAQTVFDVLRNSHLSS